ncbi:hypothetical protein [Pelagicoccus sp. SDUM812005]|uniref:hypothetical protein n=1 Tax=Pelagicoccus sp. SDUM812005 TaxID=3041257 RepID=UPI00281012E5|nr:hypothetical protein [Pelagicoccus sp. SDUM812005]MDQ8179759.1 hypothetical protein [Pelagicoccus sp. SDUM812005]
MFDVFKRDDSGFTKTLSSSFEGSGDGFERITLREDGSSVSVSVNGREVSSLGSSRMGKGSVGIVVVGAGTFKFANYSEGGEERIGTETTASNEREANRDLGPAQRFKDQAVYDVSRKNLPAYHVLVPEGWKLEGKFEHIPAFKELPYFGSIEVKAPDGRSFSFLPFAEFTYTDYAQLGFMQPYEGRPAFRQPSSVGEVIKVLAQSDPEQRISDMRIISEETVPELTQLAQRNASATIQQVQAANQRSGGVGERQSYAVEARKIVVQYTENGKRVESTTFATVSNYSYIDFNGATRIAKWNLNNVASLVGPVGSNFLEDPELAAVARSLRINPDWAYAIDQWYAGRRQIIFKEGMAKAAAASRNWQNTRATQSEDVLDISFNGWKSRNASSDRTQSMSVNSIHERTTYGTPSGGSINLPSYYQNAYTDGQGNYILHNDALYNLNTDPNLNARDWTQIEPVR